MGAPHPLPHVLIVGGGLAATAVVLRLLKDTGQPLRLTLVEPRAAVGPGVAYSTPLAEHLLNGLAQMFSLYEDDPSHFSRWLAAQAPGGWQPEPGVSFENSIPPRRVYGAYVAATLAEALARARGQVIFTHRRARATDLAPVPGGYRVTLDDGASIDAQQVVLATGVHPRAAHRQPFELDPAVLASPRYVADLWAEGAWDGVEQDGCVAFLGAGLSALDGLIAAEKAQFRGHYVALSRRGLAVQPRRAVAPWPDFLDVGGGPVSVRALLRQIRQQRRLVAQQGEDWQRLVPAIRQHVPALWDAAPLAQRRRFLQRLRSYWEVALHRSAAPALAWQERVIREGRYRHEAATVQSVELERDGRLAVTYRARQGEGARATLVVDRLVNCLGFEHDWTRLDDPLVAALLRRGLVRPDPLGFGIQATRSDCAVLDAGGQPQPGLYAVGHPLRGLFWESNAIPEQVPQAGLVARAIVHALVPAAAVEALAL